MKLLISNQHGAIVMALMPFLYGMLLSTPIWQHIFLLLAWFSLYLLTYPFFNLFKGHNLELYRKWAWIYSISAMLFALPALWHNWKIIFFVLAILPLSCVTIYYIKQRDERALLNDLAGITVFAIAGMAAYYFADFRFDERIWLVALYPSLFFIGTTLYIKSMLRERKNPRYLYASWLFHIFCVVIFLLLQQYLLALAFIPPLIRAIWMPRQKLSAKQIGLREMAVSLLFFIMLLSATV